MTNTKNLLVLMLLLALGVFTACGGSDDADKETEQQVKTRQLSKTWNVTEFESTGSTSPETVSGTTITFNSNETFQITGPDGIPASRSTEADFPTSGTWSFGGSNLSTINLTSGSNTISLKNVQISDDALEFEYAGILVKPEEEPVNIVVSAEPAE